MTKEEVIKVLECFNDWRLGAETDMPEPKEITLALIEAIELLKEPNL